MALTGRWPSFASMCLKTTFGLFMRPTHCLNVQIVPFRKTLIKSGIAMQLLHWINRDVVRCFKSFNSSITAHPVAINFLTWATVCSPLTIAWCKNIAAMRASLRDSSAPSRVLPLPVLGRPMVTIKIFERRSLLAAHGRQSGGYSLATLWRNSYRHRKLFRHHFFDFDFRIERSVVSCIA